MKHLIIAFVLLLSVKGLSQQYTLAYPKDKQVLRQTSVNLVWDESLTGSGYNITLASDSLFQNRLLDNQISSTPEYSLALSSNQTYYWYVHFTDANINSDTLEFTLFSPNDLDSLILWLRADTLVTKDVSNKISSWGDASGLDHNAAQSNVNSQPAYNDSSILDFPSVSFIGGSYFIKGEYDSVQPSNYRRSIFLLFNNQYQSSLNSFFTNYSPGPTWSGIETSIYPNRLRLWLGNGSAQSLKNFWTDFSSTHIMSINIVNSTVNVYNNAAFVDDLLYPHSLFNIQKYLLGGESGSGTSITNPFNGEVYEIIDYAKPLDSAEIQIVNKYLLDKFTPPLHIGSNILRRHGYCDTTLRTTHMYESYLWNTGDTTRSIQIAAQDTGWYWCEVPNLYGVTMRDSVYVYNLVPEAGLSDTTICLNTSSDIRLPYNSDYSFDWKDINELTVDTDSALQVSQQGRYVVKVTDSLGCFARDTVQVFVDSFAVEADLGLPKQVCTGEKLGLVSGSAKAEQWLWNTGSTDSLIVIDTAGLYILEVTDLHSCVLKDSIQIGIKGISPTVGFKVDSTCLKTHSIFNDTSFTVDASNIVSWTWEFGDGSPALTLANANPVNHTYLDSGNYVVKLTAITDSGCVNYTYQSAWVHPLPKVEITPLTGCEGHEIEFQSQAQSSFGQLTQWTYDYGDGSAPVTQNSSLAVSHIYQQDGSYNLVHKAQTQYGCIDSVSKTVEIKPAPEADFIYSTSCEGTPIYFTEQNTLPFPYSVIERKWMLTAADSSLLSNPDFDYATEGYYPVKYFVKITNGCWDTLTKNVILHPTPTATISSNPICEQTYSTLNGSWLQNTTVPYNVQMHQWMVDGQDSSYQADCDVFFSDTLVHEVIYKITTAAGCEDTVRKELKVHPNPIAGFEMDKQYGLPPLQVQFTNTTTGATSYEWTFSDGQSSTLPDPLITFSDSAVHSVLLTARTNYSCVDTLRQSVFAVYAAIDVAVSNMQVEYQNGYLTYRCLVRNMGQRPVHELWLETGYNNQYSIRERWTGTLDAGASMNYMFTAQSPISNIEDLRYFCIKVEVIEDQEDERLENNSMCREYLETTWFSSPYPNPVDDILTLDYILPLKSTVKIRIFDVNGQEISAFEVKGERGLNKLQIPTFHLSQGLYYLELNINESKQIKEFIR